MTTSRGPTSAFFQALERLESRLETPVVPGELSGWANAARAAADEAARAFDETVSGVHDRMYKDIVEQDPGAQNRVDGLREEDRRLLSDLSSLLSKISTLAKSAHYIEPDESQLEEQMDAAIQYGLKFVIDSRKQERALETWYLEAFGRDRGTAD